MGLVFNAPNIKHSKRNCFYSDSALPLIFLRPLILHFACAKNYFLPNIYFYFFPLCCVYAYNEILVITSFFYWTLCCKSHLISYITKFDISSNPHGKRSAYYGSILNGQDNINIVKR